MLKFLHILYFAESKTQWISRHTIILCTKKSFQLNHDMPILRYHSILDMYLENKWNCLIINLRGMCPVNHSFSSTQAWIFAHSTMYPPHLKTESFHICAIHILWFSFIQMTIFKKKSTNFFKSR